MLWRGKRLMALAFVLLSPGGVMACAHSAKTVAGQEEARPPTTDTQDRAPGEYLVTVQKGGDEALIRKLFAQFSVKDVQNLSNSLFLLKIEEDPGPAAIKRKGEESNQIRSVQPNFVYRINRPGGNLQGPIK